MNESLTVCAPARSIDEPVLQLLNASANTMTASKLRLAHNDVVVLELAIGAAVIMRFTA